MASGLGEPKWNNADIVSAEVDWDAVHAWYEARGVPWGLRVPLGMDVDVGDALFVKRCGAIDCDAWVRPPAGDVRVRQAAPSEGDLVAALDCEMFGGGDPAVSRAWSSRRSAHLGSGTGSRVPPVRRSGPRRRS